MTNAAILACWRESPFILPEQAGNEMWIGIGGLYRLQVQAITPGNEANYGLEFLYNTLSGDATLATYATGGVWTFLAPTSVTSPFVVVGYQSGIETLTINVVRLMTQPLYTVKAMGHSGDMAQIRQAADRIDALLGRTSGTV